MNLLFHAQFTAAKAGKTGLTPTIDVVRIARADGTATTIVTGGAATEGSHGCYRYLLTGADLQSYDYIGTFITTDATVDLKEVASGWTRWSEAVATDADGKVRVGSNDDKTGYALSDPGVDAVVNAVAIADPAGYSDTPSAWIQQSINTGAGGSGATPAEIWTYGGGRTLSAFTFQVVLSAAGMANVKAEADTDIRQALSLILSAVAGANTGAGTGHETFKTGDGAADRIVADVDTDGNRTNIVRTPYGG